MGGRGGTEEAEPPPKAEKLGQTLRGHGEVRSQRLAVPKDGHDQRLAGTPNLPDKEQQPRPKRGPKRGAEPLALIEQALKAEKTAFSNNYYH